MPLATPPTLGPTLAPSRAPRTARVPRTPRWRLLLPLCVLILLVGPGCVAVNPFYRLTAAAWAAVSGLLTGG